MPVRELLRQRTADLLRQRERVRRDANPDAVHDLRVATRRLQEALRFLEPFLPETPRRRLNRRARRIRRSLGELRNADVTRQLLSDLSGRLPAIERGALSRLAAQVEARAGILRGVGDGAPAGLAARRGLPVAGIIERINLLLAATPADRPVDLRRRSAQVIRQRVDGVARMLPRAARGGATASHRLRIAIKKYRYALEIAERLGAEEHGFEPGKLRAALASARGLQTQLGQLHDLDVLIQLVADAAHTRPSTRLLTRLRRQRAAMLPEVLQSIAGFVMLAPAATVTPTPARRKASG